MSDLRILIHGINFAPDLIGTAKYTGEMAGWLAAQGHAVRVVTAPPYYPDWQVAAGYSASRYRRQDWRWDSGAGAEVWRCPLWVPAQPGGARRLAHLASFAATSAPVVLAQARWRPDLVVVIEPTLCCAPAALLAARLCGARTWLHIQDLEVDAAFDLGLLPKGVLRRFALGCEGALLRGFDCVSTISEAMRERVIAKGIAPERAPLLPNWADVDAIRPLSTPSPLRAELNIAPEAVVALYSGNLGEKQGLELLVEAARALQDDPAVVFVIGGAGSAKARLMAMAGDLTNIRWIPLQPAGRLNDLLNLADIHLLPQRADAADLVMPSKLTGMLASGRPVLATAAPDTQVGKVAAQCGRRVPSADLPAFAGALRALAADEPTRARLGAAARAYAEDNLAQDAIMARFVQQAERLADPTPERFTESR